MPLEDIDGNLLDIDGNLVDTDTYTSIVADDSNCSPFGTALFSLNDKVKVIGNTKELTITGAKFVMTKYGTYEIAYTVAAGTNAGLVLEKMLER